MWSTCCSQKCNEFGHNHIPSSLPPLPVYFFPHECMDGAVRLSEARCIYFSHTRLQQLDAVKPDGALNEALRQVGLADVILLNKIDLVTKEQLSTIKQRVR